MKKIRGLISRELVTVRPMSPPSRDISWFYLDIKYVGNNDEKNDRDYEDTNYEEWVEE